MNWAKHLYFILGIFFVIFAYIGFIVPGIPFSIFLVGAAWAFSKSSDKMHAWLYAHPWFGEFLTNWTHYKIFPLKAKVSMIVVMLSTLVITYLTLGNSYIILYTGATMLIVAFLTLKYPSTKEEYEDRLKNKRKIGPFR